MLDRKFTSYRLKQLIRRDNLFPNFTKILDDFEAMITWKKSGTNKVFEPKTGIDPEFDSANEVVDEVKKSLANYLK